MALSSLMFFFKTKNRKYSSSVTFEFHSQSVVKQMALMSFAVVIQKLYVIEFSNHPTTKQGISVCLNVYYSLILRIVWLIYFTLSRSNLVQFGHATFNIS